MLKKNLNHLKTSFIWSSFVSFSILFPFLNTIELIAHQTQKTGAILCMVVNVLLFLTFFIFPKVLHFSVELIFHGFSPIFLFLFEKGNNLVNKYPRLVGLFYGLGFLTFLLRLDNADSVILFWLSLVFLIIRNLTIIPAIGFFGLAKWTASVLETLVKENKIKEQDVQLGLKDFNVFNNKLFPHLPLSQNNPNAYSLKTKRMMFGWTVKTLSSLPENQAMKKAVEVTVGSTITGSAGYTLWTTGGRVEDKVNSNLGQTTLWIDEALASPSASPEFRDLARQARVIADKKAVEWAENRGSTRVHTAVAHIFNNADLRASVADANKLANAAAELKGLASLETVSQKEKITQGKDILADLKRTVSEEAKKPSVPSEANSILEFTIFNWPIWLKNKLKFLIDLNF